MSEAKQITFEIGAEWFVRPCQRCGGPVYTWTGKEYYATCQDCKREIKEINWKSRAPIRQAEADRRFEIACEYIRSKGLWHEYCDHFEKIHKLIYAKGLFQSSNEILAALELERNGCKYRHQVKMGHWKADFVLPDMKVVLEIDGAVFHDGEKRRKFERLRDGSIIAYLGPKWEIVRIPDELLRKDLTKLLVAVDILVKRRKAIRETYKGKLPDWYCDNQE